MRRKTDIDAHKPNAALEGLCAVSERTEQVISDSLNKMEDMAEVSSYSGFLPLPPSANALVMPLRGRLIKSKVGREWAKTAAAILGKASPPLEGALSLYASFKVRSVSSDVSNRIKALEDALVAAGFMFDDCQVVQIQARKSIVTQGSVVDAERCWWELKETCAAAETEIKIRKSKKGGGHGRQRAK